MEAIIVRRAEMADIDALFCFLRESKCNLPEYFEAKHLEMLIDNPRGIVIVAENNGCLVGAVVAFAGVRCAIFARYELPQWAFQARSKLQELLDDEARRLGVFRLHKAVWHDIDKARESQLGFAKIPDGETWMAKELLLEPECATIDGIAINRAQHQDLAAVRKLLAEDVNVAFQDWEDELLEAFVSNCLCPVFVARKNGEVIAALLGQIGLMGYLAHVFVHPERREHGVATALQAAFENACRDAGVYRSYLATVAGNERACKHFQRHDYVSTQCGWMEKDLPEAAIIDINTAIDEAPIPALATS